MIEEWKPTQFYPEIYEVSNFGRIRHSASKRIKTLRPRFSKTGVLVAMFVQLCDKKTQKSCRVHRLVLHAFSGDCPQKMEGCHNDGNPENNNITNLRWDYPANNQADRVLHGTSNRGERCATSKLTKEKIQAIRTDNRLQKEIATDYGITQGTVSRIKAGVRWHWIPLQGP